MKRSSTSARAHVGAKVRALATIRGQPDRRLREVFEGSGLYSQNDLRAHFG